MTDASMIPTVESVAVSARELKAKAFAVSKRVGWVAGLVTAWYSFGSLLAALATLGVVLASVRVSGFLRWARTRRHDLRAAGRPVPSWRELLAVRRSEQKRLANLIAHWPSRCTENGIKLAGRAPVLVDHRMDLDGNVTAKLIRTGFDPDDISAKSRKLAKAIGCRELVVRETSPGCADVSFLWTDPLRNVLPLADLPVSPSGKFSFGVTAAGVATLEADLSTIFVGVTRGGKSNAIKAVLGDIVRKGEPTRLYVVNNKGSELRAYKDFKGKQMGNVEVRDYVEDGKEEQLEIVKRFERAMNLRAGNMKAVKLTKPTKENPRCILLVDELPDLPREAFKDGRFSPVGRILGRGGSSMYTILGGSQLLYSSEFGSIKGLFTQRGAFRTTSEAITDTILGEGASKRGALCHKLRRKEDRGVGYIADEEETLVKFRAAKVTDQDFWHIVRGIVPPGMKLTADPDPEPIEATRAKLSRWARCGLVMARRAAKFVLAPIRRRARGILPALRRLSVGARLSYLVRAGRIASTEPRAAVLAFLGRRAARAAVSGAVFLQLVIGMAR